MTKHKMLSSVIRMFSSVSLGNEMILSTNNRVGTWLNIHNKQKQLWSSPKTQMINVKFEGFDRSSNLQMIKGVSTPMDCARHLSETLVKHSVVALVNDTPWDMNRPLISDCAVKFVNFKDSYINPTIANQAFWNSCSFLMGVILEKAFYEKYNVHLIDFHTVNPKTGSFVCDIRFTSLTPSLSENPWLPSDKELLSLSIHAMHVAQQNFPFELVDVHFETNQNLLNDLFNDNLLRFRLIKQRSPSTITLYRVNNFVEAFANGPLIPSTGLIGRYSISSFRYLGRLRPFSSDDNDDCVGTDNRVQSVYRVQGTALPSAFLTHFTTFDSLINWSRKPNSDTPANPDYLENTIL